VLSPKAIKYAQLLTISEYNTSSISPCHDGARCLGGGNGTTALSIGHRFVEFSCYHNLIHKISILYVRTLCVHTTNYKK